MRAPRPHPSGWRSAPKSLSEIRPPPRSATPRHYHRIEKAIPPGRGCRGRRRPGRKRDNLAQLLNVPTTQARGLHDRLGRLQPIPARGEVFSVGGDNTKGPKLMTHRDRPRDRNGGFPRLSDGVPRGSRCPASPRHALLAENPRPQDSGKPSLWVITKDHWHKKVGWRTGRLRGPRQRDDPGSEEKTPASRDRCRTSCSLAKSARRGGEIAMQPAGSRADSPTAMISCYTADGCE